MLRKCSLPWPAPAGEAAKELCHLGPPNPPQGCLLYPGVGGRNLENSEGVSETCESRDKGGIRPHIVISGLFRLQGAGNKQQSLVGRALSGQL